MVGPPGWLNQAMAAVANEAGMEAEENQTQCVKYATFVLLGKERNNPAPAFPAVHASLTTTISVRVFSADISRARQSASISNHRSTEKIGT